MQKPDLSAFTHRALAERTIAQARIKADRDFKAAGISGAQRASVQLQMDLGGVFLRWIADRRDAGASDSETCQISVHAYASMVATLLSSQTSHSESLKVIGEKLMVEVFSTVQGLTDGSIAPGQPGVHATCGRMPEVGHG